VKKVTEMIADTMKVYFNIMTNHFFFSPHFFKHNKNFFLFERKKFLCQGKNLAARKKASKSRKSFWASQNIYVNSVTRGLNFKKKKRKKETDFSGPMMSESPRLPRMCPSAGRGP